MSMTRRLAPAGRLRDRGDALDQSVDAADRFQAVGHHDEHVGLRGDEGLGRHRLHALPADLAGDVDAADRVDERVGAGVPAEDVVHVRAAAHVEEEHPRPIGDVAPARLPAISASAAAISASSRSREGVAARRHAERRRRSR